MARPAQSSPWTPAPPRCAPSRRPAPRRTYCSCPAPVQARRGSARSQRSRRRRGSLFRRGRRCAWPTRRRLSPSTRARSRRRRRCSGSASPCARQLPPRQHTSWRSSTRRRGMRSAGRSARSRRSPIVARTPRSPSSLRAASSTRPCGSMTVATRTGRSRASSRWRTPPSTRAACSWPHSTRSPRSAFSRSTRRRGSSVESTPMSAGSRRSRRRPARRPTSCSSAE